MQKIHKNITKIINRDCPPLIKPQKGKPIFEINYEYFNKLYNKEFKSATEIFKERKLFQDRFLIYCYEYRTAQILEYILFKLNPHKGASLNLLPMSILLLS